MINFYFFRTMNHEYTNRGPNNNSMNLYDPWRPDNLCLQKVGQWTGNRYNKTSCYLSKWILDGPTINSTLTSFQDFTSSDLLFQNRKFLNSKLYMDGTAISLELVLKY